MRLTDCLDGLGSSVAYFPKLVKLVGGFQPTLFLCQMYYWLGKQKDPDGWIHKSREEIEKETGLTRCQQETARRKLKALGLIQERKRGLPRRLEFWLDVDRLKELWKAFILGVKGAIAEVTSLWNGKEDEVEEPTGECAKNQQTSMQDTGTLSISTDVTPIKTDEEKSNQEEGRSEQESSPLLTAKATTPQIYQPTHEDKHSGVSFEEVEQTKKPAVKADKFFGRSKYDIWAERQHPALVYVAEETPWLEQPGRVQYVQFLRDFLIWGGKEFSKFQGTGDMAKSIADFSSAMMNNPDKILVRWEQYQAQISKQQALVAVETEDWRIAAERQDQERRRQEEAKQATQATATRSLPQSDRIAALARAAQLRRSRTHA